MTEDHTHARGTANHPPLTRVIALGNQKGGCGKTTNTVHLAAALGELGKKVLVIDLDANCGATRALGLGTEWLGTFEALLGEPVEDMILRTDPAEGIELPPNVELLPARRQLEDFEQEVRARNKFQDPTTTLQPVVDGLMGEYDFILLDTAPRADAPTVAAYRATQWFILSTEASPLSVQGLNDALGDIVAVREAGNAQLRLLGVVLCKMDGRTRIAAEYLSRIRAEFEAAGEMGAFETVIGRTTEVERAQDAGKTLFESAPDHKVTNQFRELAREVLTRIGVAYEVEHGESDASPEPEVTLNPRGGGGGGSTPVTEPEEERRHA